MTAPKGKILVIRGGAIGDFILTLPAIAALRERFPNVHLEVLGYPHIAQLALAGGLVDAVRAIESQALAGFFALGGTLSQPLCGYFSECDVIVSYLYDPDGIFQNNVARCSAAQFIAGPHRASDSDSTQATKVYLKPLEQLAIFDADEVPRLKVAQPSNPRVMEMPAPMVKEEASPAAGEDAGAALALHPGSGSERKNWPEAKWRALIDRLMDETRHRLLLIGGEAEGDRLKRLAAPLPKARFALARSLPLVELAQWLQECAGFVGHDSGITHLAASLGLPCVVLWGDTAEQVWRPGGEKIWILREPAGLRALSVQRVRDEIRGMIGN